MNPISKGSPDKYFFLLQDTLLYGEHDSIFVISFRPRKNTNFDGLKGRISINTHNWAVQNVIADPSGSDFSIIFRIEQMYDLIDGKQWFPVQVNNQAIIRQVSMKDTSIGIGLGRVPDSLRDKTIQIPFGIGKRYIRDINLQPELKNREFGNTEVEVDPNHSILSILRTFNCCKY